MTNGQLLNMYSNIGLVLEEASNGQYKGNSCNVRQWHSFRTWINKSGKIAIKTLGVQKSFNIGNKDQLKHELKGFELI